MKFRFETSPAPHSLHKNRLEDEGGNDFTAGHGRANVECPPSGVQFSIHHRDPSLIWPLDVQCWLLDVPRFRADVGFQTSDFWMKSFLKYWLPLLTWLVVIFVGSTSIMSAEHTSRYVVPLLLWLKPGLSPRAIWIIHSDAVDRSLLKITKTFADRRHRCRVAIVGDLEQAGGAIEDRGVAFDMKGENRRADHHDEIMTPQGIRQLPRRGLEKACKLRVPFRKTAARRKRADPDRGFGLLRHAYHQFDSLRAID